MNEIRDQWTVFFQTSNYAYVDTDSKLNLQTCTVFTLVINKGATELLLPLSSMFVYLDIWIQCQDCSWHPFLCACSCQSSLLSAILGELSQGSGVVKVKGELTYTSQQPWIFPGTIRSNILFGKAFSPQKYDRVLRACVLKRVRNTSRHVAPCLHTL